jgi:dolichyl-phosphate beta-glucosyltransferase
MQVNLPAASDSRLLTVGRSLAFSHGGWATKDVMSVEPILSVVVPAWNEEHRLPASLRDILEYLEKQTYSYEVIVVDDGSDDNTVGVTQPLLAQHPQLRLIENDHRGKGYAVRTGMLAARGQHVIFTDADLATPIEEIDKVLPLLKDSHDVVVGSREGLGAQRHGEPLHRHLMGRVFNLVVRLLAVGGFQDTQCGFKGFRREVAQDVFSRLRIHGTDAGVIAGGAVTAFDVEVLYLAQRQGYRIAEVPVEWHYGEKSKVDPLRDSLRMFRDVLQVRLNAWRGFYDDTPL